MLEFLDIAAPPTTPSADISSAVIIGILAVLVLIIVIIIGIKIKNKK